MVRQQRPFGGIRYQKGGNRCQTICPKPEDTLKNSYFGDVFRRSGEFDEIEVQLRMECQVKSECWNGDIAPRFALQLLQLMRAGRLGQVECLELALLELTRADF